MSVGETYEIVVAGREDGLAIAERLAERVGSLARWVATWTTPERALKLKARCPRVGVVTGEYATAHAAFVSRPTAAEIRGFIDFADIDRAEMDRSDTDPLCVHFGPVMYVGDEGPDAPWVSYVGHDGRTREDAKVYAIELARDAVPLTTHAPRPIQPDFCYEPRPAEGWALRLSVTRDHMPVEQITRWLASAAAVPPEACSKIVFT